MPIDLHPRKLPKNERAGVLRGILVVGALLVLAVLVRSLFGANAHTLLTGL